LKRRKSGLSSVFKKMPGFHRLESLWKLSYRAIAIEPVLTRSADEETKYRIDEIIGRKTEKTTPDMVPLVFGDRVVFTGNAVKGLFRHVISSQLTSAGHTVCVQDVKAPKKGPPEGRQQQCKPENPCFICTWFGTGSRQGALHFSFLESVKNVSDVVARDPIPMIAMMDEFMATSVEKRAFVIVVPVKEGTEFTGWIKGVNLSGEIIGAVKEVVDMSEKGFIQFGGLKTRGYGSMRLEITSIEKYSTTPFKLEKEYKGEELRKFLESCQAEYRNLLTRTGSKTS
jgi:CRISPR/Cas system CSM-associated protein Csm3 (group 7 of RAMP superfamily)